MGVIVIIIQNRESFLRAAQKNAAEIYDTVLNSSGRVALGELNPKTTALIIVDMVNGFVKKGALSSPNARSINGNIARLLQACNSLNIRAVCFADSHTLQSAEFKSFPVHCLNTTDESRVTDEIAVGKFKLIYKNSTNAFLEPEFSAWLKENDRVDTFIVTGCCTDLCVSQFALTLKTDFNRRNRKSRVIVPAELSATYDAPCHSSEFMDFVSFYNMLLCGVEVTTNFQY